LKIRGEICFIFLICLIGFVRPAGAQELLDKNVHYFQPVVDGSGMLSTYGSEALTMFRMHYGLWADDAINPVEYLAHNDRRFVVVENQLAGNLVYSVGFFNWLNVGFAFPFVAYRRLGDELDFEGIDSFALEDMRFDVKGILFDRRQQCLGAALLGRVTVPVGYKENNFVSDHYPTVTSLLVVDLGRRWWTVAANLGYKYYPNPQQSEFLDLRVRDELLLNLGATLRVSTTQQLIVDSATRTFANSPFSEPDLDYSEIVLAYRNYWQGLNYTALTAGVGFGLLSGIGDPLVRVFIGITRDEKRLGPGDVYF